MSDGIDDALRVMFEYVRPPYVEKQGDAQVPPDSVIRRDPRNREMMIRILEAGATKDPLGDFVTSLAQMAGRQLNPDYVKWWVEVRTFPLTEACVRVVAVPHGLSVETAHDFDMELVLKGWNRAEALLAIANGVGEVRSRL